MASNGKKWFAEEFLPSLEKRMTNPKYPNRCILSEAQANVCFKYMTAIQCKDASYGTNFYNYRFDTENKIYLMTFAGRWTFMSMFNKK